MKGGKMKIKINDPFGFSKAINFEKLNDPEVLKALDKSFNGLANLPSLSKDYKKAVNTLKRKVK